ncbi:MAG: hypothetical protein J6M41_09120 [Prevotella sp.]|nr:hypothetical protein [Prevotella sp.]
MKRYLKNLLSALLGSNPYQAERDDLEEKLEKAGENVRGLKELYYNVVEKWGSGKQQVASLQQLVENLRERINDKDAAIAQLQQDYRKLSERYNDAVRELEECKNRD